MLSEIQLCESCKGVMKQFMLRYPNAKVPVVSTKESRMKRRYKEINKERDISTDGKRNSKLFR